MDAPSTEKFAHAGSLADLRSKGRLVVHGRHRPILLVYDRCRVFALDNRCPHMGFPLARGSVEDGILTCHWHHARFDLASGCTFDLWADDVPTCPVEVRDGEVFVKTTFGLDDPAAHWQRRLADGLAHDLGLVVAKAVHGQLAADVPRADIVRQVALYGAQNRDGWGVGLTILTALANLLCPPPPAPARSRASPTRYAGEGREGVPVLPAEDVYLALFHGARRVAADCDGQPQRRERAPLYDSAGNARDPALIARWLERWTRVRHREAAERTLLTAIASGLSPAVLADMLLAAETQRVFADTGHSLDFINKAFECLDLIGWEHAPALIPTVVGQMVAARSAEESTAWRAPVDLIALCEDAAHRLPPLFLLPPPAPARSRASSTQNAGRVREGGVLLPPPARGRVGVGVATTLTTEGREGSPAWSGHAALAENLLGDEPAAIVDDIAAAISTGARPADLGRALAYAAALRLARFGTANEHSDWETAHHVFTHANAVHQLLARIATNQQEGAGPLPRTRTSDADAASPLPRLRGRVREGAQGGDSEGAEIPPHPEVLARSSRASLEGRGCPDPDSEDAAAATATDSNTTAIRAVLHGAMALYLTRYLNVPPARIPGDDGERLDDLPADAEAIRAALLDAFDRQRQVDLAAKLVARHLTLGHPPQPLIATLARALLREDAGFHAYQMLEAGVRQFTAWSGDRDAGRHILIAVARYLAAHSPTERAALQTADIARRLMQGAELHQEAGAS